MAAAPEMAGVAAMGWFSRRDRTPPDHKPAVDRNSVVVRRLQQLVKELEEIDEDLHAAIDRGKKPDAGR